MTTDAAAQALLGKAPAQHTPVQPPMPPPPSAASSGSDTNYQGLTNEEDFEQVATATKVNIISCPYHETNPIAGRKAAATKDFHDDPTAGVYTFNPNSGLKAAAAASGMTPEEQGKKWLRLWTEVAKRVQETGGTCFVIVKSMGPGPNDFKVEGNAQEGEVCRRADARGRTHPKPRRLCPAQHGALTAAAVAARTDQRRRAVEDPDRVRQVLRGTGRDARPTRCAPYTLAAGLHRVRATMIILGARHRYLAPDNKRAPLAAWC